jgi:hypothetical protein
MDVKRELAWLRWRQRAQHFPQRFQEWLEEPIRRKSDHELLLGAFLKSGGAALTEASELSATSVGKYPFDDEPSTIGLTSGSADYERAVQEIRTQGFSILPWRLSESQVNTLTQHLSQPIMTLSSDDTSVNGKRAHVSFEHPRAEKYAIDTSDVLTTPLAVQLMLDRGVLQVAQEYLGSIPQIDIATAWFSFPMQRASSEAAQMFHFDLDRSRWLKVFYFLTDVTPMTGAHVFLPGTHQDGAIPLNLRKQGYSRMSDESVRASLPDQPWETIGGERGTILLEDTRGIHKGLPVLEGHRLVLQFQYSQNLFGSRSSVFGQSSSISEPLMNFAAKYPKVLAGMSDDFSYREGAF